MINHDLIMVEKINQVQLEQQPLMHKLAEYKSLNEELDNKYEELLETQIKTKNK